MHFSIRKLGVLLIALFTFSALAAAENAREIPLRGAPAPSLAEAARVINAARVSPLGEPLPNTHIVSPNGIIFQTLTPCRLVDTRGGPYFYTGGPFASGETRTYDPAQIPLVTCGGSSLPNALAWYMNITVTGTTGGPAFLTAFATGTTRPTVATVNWGFAGAQVNNSVIVAAGTSSAFDVYVSSSTDVIIDIVGLFISNLTDTAGQLAVTTSIPGLAAIVGFNNSNTNGSHGVGGFEGGTGTVFGVQGQVGGSAGAGSAGVHGIAGSSSSFGVLGDSGVIGVVGKGSFRGVEGDGTAGGSCGTCGFGFAATNASGVTGQAGIAGADAVFAIGNLTATGTKSFIDPDPNDPTKQINYIALEGPTAGTYFTGRATAVGGIARIVVPEHFRAVTDTEGITVQATPIGQMANFAVLSVDLNEIVIRASRDVDFFYTINGVRATHRDHNAIEENTVFRPDSRGGGTSILSALSDAQKQVLIQNQVLNPDGTWNRQTAQRLGWRLPDTK